jgi:HEAT repeat protein
MLIEGVKSNAYGVKEDAVIYLGRIGPGAKSAVPTLIEELKTDEDSTIRMLIAEALGYIGDKSALEILRYASENDSSINDVRNSAKKAISRINQE